MILKDKFGMSMQALLYRLKDTNIISPTYHKEWCININRMGWKNREPNERTPESPKWLRLNVLKAVAEDLITQEEGARILGAPLEKEKDLPLSLISRRAFMKLPLAERNRILSEQAEKMKELYEDNRELKEFLTDQIIDY